MKMKARSGLVQKGKEAQSDSEKRGNWNGRKGAPLYLGNGRGVRGNKVGGGKWEERREERGGRKEGGGA